MGKFVTNHRGEVIEVADEVSATGQPDASSSSSAAATVDANPVVMEAEAQAPTAPQMNDMEFYIRDSVAAILKVFEPTRMNEVLCERVPSCEELRSLALQYGGYMSELF